MNGIERVGRHQAARSRQNRNYLYFPTISNSFPSTVILINAPVETALGRCSLMPTAGGSIPT